MLALVLCLPGCRKRTNPPPENVQTIPTKTGIEMVAIPAGEFMMGGDGGEDDEKPAHKGQISAFYMDKCEVTQAAYERLMGRNPSKFAEPNKPVERVSWLAAIKFCNMRSLREGFQPCYNPETLACDFDANGYRLPTEAEWEYACRAGTTGAYSFGDEPGTLGRCGWFKGNSGQTTHPVGQKKPNPWGLCDMHGNVWEWCNDFYSDAGYQKAEGKDPRGPASGQKRVLRGGSWRDPEERCRSSARHGEAPGFADVCFGYEAYGFRCVRKAP